MKYEEGEYTVEYTRITNPSSTHTRTFSRTLKGQSTTVDPWGMDENE